MQFMRKSLISLKKLLRMNGRNKSLVVIMGSTGCGKTKLSLEIAKQFNGEIISADSMQVYKGLDIVTNKATVEERQQIPHHLIDFLDPLKRFSVIDFRNRALKVINNLMDNNKVAILVGGTNYYIESILWEVLIINEENNSRDDNQKLVFDKDKEKTEPIDCNDMSDELTKEDVFSSSITFDRFENISSDKLYNILKEIDPKSAQSLHQNDKRKIIRCLQVFQQNGKLCSEIIADQRSSEGGSQLGGPLRFKNSVILWLDCDKNILDKRLDKRVDDMIENGLIDELLDFHQKYNRERVRQNLNPDYTKGIFQSIGFKEFHNYLLLSEEQRKSHSKQSEALFNKGVEAMKLVTKRYVNKQLKWIRNRFLKLNDREVPNIYRLNTTNLDQWREQVCEPSFAIVDSFVNERPLPDHIKPLTKIEMNNYVSTQFRCDICQKLLCGYNSYESHLKSKSHKYRFNYEKTLKKQKYYQLLSLLKSHQKSLITGRRHSL